MALLNSMSTRGKVTLAGCALVFLAVAVFIMKMASAPSYTTVMSGVDPAKTSQITAALTAAGVPFELQNGGTAIAVQKGKETAANVALASKGLNSASTQPGFEILDQQKLGASSQQQQIAYQRGLEGTIANTIGQIQGAQGAQVHLTLSQDNLFADESRPATAAVLIPADASTMDSGSVRGIANLVASSVPGLKASAVTITDGSGTMLWPSGDGVAGSPGGLPSKVAAEAAYNVRLETALNAKLTEFFGPGKAQVQVHSDLDMDKLNEEKLTYGKSGVALTKKTQSETLKGQGAGAAGAAGNASNAPSYAQNATTSGGNSNYNSKSGDATFGVDKTVTHREQAAGTVNRLDIGVVLDSSLKLTPAQVSSLQKTLQSGAGFQASRGDTFNLTSLPFAKQPAPAKTGGPIPPAFAGILKGVGLGIGALLFLFFITRHLKKREREELADAPSWLRQLEAASPQPQFMAMPQMAMGGADGVTEVMPSIATEDPRRQQLDTIIQHEPERVAAHLRQWITEDNK